MTRDKSLLLFFAVLAILTFSGAVYVMDRYEKEGWFQGTEMWRQLYDRYKKRLGEMERRKEGTKGDWKPEDKLLLARTLHNVGATAWRLQKFEEAEQFFRRSLDSKHACKKAITSSIGETLDSLGYAYRDLGLIETSRVCTKKALLLFEKSYGEKSRSIARVEEALAMTHGRLGEHKEAEKSLKKALAIYKEEEDLGAQARCHAELSFNCLARNDLTAARREMAEATPLFSKKWGKRFTDYFDSDLIFYLQTLGRVEMAQGNIKEATSHLEAATRQSIKFSGDDSILSAMTRTYLGECLVKAGHPAQAEIAFKKALSTFKLLGLEGRGLEALTSYGDLLRKSKRTEEAAQIDRQIEELTKAGKNLDEYDRQKAAQMGAELKPKIEEWLKRDSTDSWVAPVIGAVTLWAFTGLFACAMACAAVAARKRRSAIAWFFIGFIFGAVGLLLILALPKASDDGIPINEDGQLILDARLGTFILSWYPFVGILLTSVFISPLWLRDGLIATIIAWAVCFFVFPAVWCWFVAAAQGRRAWLWAACGLLFGIIPLYCLLLMKAPREARERIDDYILDNRPSEYAMLSASFIHLLSLVALVWSIISQVEKHVEW